MNTVLDILICGENVDLARSAANECFGEVERMENIMSMYRYGSDISMINNAEPEAIVKLADITADCLAAAFYASAITKGAIDVCMGEFFLKAKNDKVLKFPETPRRGKFAFDPDELLIKKLEHGKIDLGAIGKGFAVDTMIDKLVEAWDIKSAMINFGGSSVAVLGKPEDKDEWTVTLGGGDNIEVALENLACGASGTAVLGRHIVNGRTGEVPATQPFRTWAFADSAAIADAISTSFMVLDKNEIAEICQEHGFKGALQETDKAEIELINF